MLKKKRDIGIWQDYKICDKIDFLDKRLKMSPKRKTSFIKFLLDKILPNRSNSNEDEGQSVRVRSKNTLHSKALFTRDILTHNILIKKDKKILR